MIKTFTTFAAVAAFTAAASLAPQTAEARNDGLGIAAGVIGGIAAGAIIAGSANAQPAPPPPAYYAPPAPAYYPPPPPQRECYYDRERYWDEYAGVWRRGPRHMVCD